MMRHKSTALRLIVLGLIPLVLIGCGGGHTTVSHRLLLRVRHSQSVRLQSPRAGSATTFTGVFAPTAPAGGSLTWSITPVDGGTITGAGIYTASSTAGKYSILATWTPSISSKAVILKGSAAVNLLAVPQLDAVITPDSGAGVRRHPVRRRDSERRRRGPGHSLPCLHRCWWQHAGAQWLRASGLRLWFQFGLQIATDCRDIFNRKEKRVCAANSTFCAWF